MSTSVGERPDGDVLADRRSGPAVARMVLGTLLRRWRESRGVTRTRAGAAIGVSVPIITGLELGRDRFTPRDVLTLCTVYGIGDHLERTTLLSLATQAAVPGWWSRYDDVIPDWFEPYLGLEQVAGVIRSYELQFIPGLLQTPDYARAVIRLGHAPDERIERRVELRMRRRRILWGPRPVHLWVILDETAVRRPIGGPAVMFAQLEHLIDICELANVTIQVLPFHAGGHVGGPITVLRLPPPELPDVVYLEQPTSAVYPGRREDQDYFRHTMNCLATRAELAIETPEILRQILKEVAK